MATLGEMVQHVRDTIGPEAGRDVQFMIFLGCGMCGRRLLDKGPEMFPDCLLVSYNHQVVGVFCHVCRPRVMERLEPCP